MGSLWRRRVATLSRSVRDHEDGSIISSSLGSPTRCVFLKCSQRILNKGRRVFTSFSGRSDRTSKRNVKIRRSLWNDQAIIESIRIETRQDPNVHELRIQHERRKREIFLGYLAHLELCGLLLVFSFVLREHLDSGSRNVVPSLFQDLKAFLSLESLTMEQPGVVVRTSSLLSGTNFVEATTGFSRDLSFSAPPFSRYL